MDKLIGYFK